MFVITIWQTKRADPPEQKHSCQLINEIFNINVEFYQLKRWCWWWCWPMTRSGALTGTQMWLMGCEPRQGNEHFLVSSAWQWLELEFSWEQTLENISFSTLSPVQSTNWDSDSRLFLSALSLWVSNIFWFRKFPPPATAGGWNDFLGLGRGSGLELELTGCHIMGKWNPPVRRTWLYYFSHCHPGMLGGLTPPAYQNETLLVNMLPPSQKSHRNPSISWSVRVWPSLRWVKSLVVLNILRRCDRVRVQLYQLYQCISCISGNWHDWWQVT